MAKANAGKRVKGDLAQIRAALLRGKIEAAGGATRGSTATLARNETGLVEAFAKALSGKTLIG